MTNEITSVVNTPSANIADLSKANTLGLTQTGLAWATTGGNSSKFVKGDGSLDNSTYLTAEADTLATVTARGATTAVASTFLEQRL